MDEMTVGIIYIALAVINEFMKAIEKGVMAAGTILFLLSIGYGIYDRIRSRHGKTDKENTP